MREAFLAFSPKLELMADILAPSVGETPAQNPYNNVDKFAMLVFAESAYHSCLNEAMNG